MKRDEPSTAERKLYCQTGLTDDDKFNINTILNADKQREALIKMAEDYIYLNPPDHQKWLNGVVSAITNLREDG